MSVEVVGAGLAHADAILTPGALAFLTDLESHLEARLWNEIFLWAQDALGIPRGSARATVLIETIHAAFEMDEILWELREHASGLNAGRWDYLFSCIKAFGSRPPATLPDRAELTMTVPFMRAVLGKAPHQRNRLRDDVDVAARELADIRVEAGRITVAGVALNISVALQYLDAWLGGNGAAAINNLMEDAATAEIARSQLWQWRVTGVRLDDGTLFDASRYGALRAEAIASIPRRAADRLDEAAALLDDLVLRDSFASFLALDAYERLERDPREDHHAG